MSKSIFSQIQNPQIKSNTFNLSHDRKLSMNMGDLVPILVIETIPGDKFKMSTSQMIRLAPLVAPIMHQVNVYTHFFFVPNRLVWDSWEDFITGGEDGLDNSVFPVLNVTATIAEGSLYDYMGLPSGSTANMLPSAIPFAAYQKIWNDYYRDQNLQTETDTMLTDGQQSPGIFDDLKTRAWHHDYFTSALPWTQKGAEATIPLGTSAPIDFDVVGSKTAYAWQTSGDTKLGSVDDIRTTAGGDLELHEGSTWWPAAIDNSEFLTADLSGATAATINDLRNAFRLQEWLEKNARGGSRYIESILSHFGVQSSDSRLQRPEYLGGGSTPITFSEVLQTSANTSEPTPQGNMAGHGITVGANGSFSYSCEEHGFIIGIMSVLPKTAYYQGIPKHFLKTDKFDYYFPSFAHLGEQPIINKELYFDTDGNNDLIFGYTPRYAEYKFINSSVHGTFRGSLDFWHMARKFGSRPLLNETFIVSDPTTRVFAVTSGEHLYAHIYHSIKATRKMPFFGTPKSV